MSVLAFFLWFEVGLILGGLLSLAVLVAIENRKRRNLKRFMA